MNPLETFLSFGNSMERLSMRELDEIRRYTEYSPNTGKRRNNAAAKKEAFNKRVAKRRKRRRNAK